MKLDIKFPLVFISFVLCTGLAKADSAEERIVKQNVRSAGFLPSAELYFNPDENLAKFGKIFFESNNLSLNGNISCRTCHLDRFGSTDGIPIAAAVGGSDDGPKRLLSGAKLLPRNALALWGRGAKKFDVFFWDGRVDFSGSKKISQFGTLFPSNDPLITADHLPVVEIREMLEEDAFIEKSKSESVKKSKAVYDAIVKNVVKKEEVASNGLAAALNKSVSDLQYLDIARSLAAFIRFEFRIQESKLERVMAGKENFSQNELKGARVFYGKGACVTCHSGPHFSDFKFYSVPFPQLGFGRNGFGVDHGRYNVTFNPNDMYKFRTPPLYNVETTGPYGHSGSVREIKDAVTAHYDPLALIDISKMKQFDRFELSKRLTLSDSTTRVNYLSDSEVSQVVDFLKTLTFINSKK